MLIMNLLNILNRNLRFLLLTLLLVSSAIFRFWDLGYSDYIPDEYKSFIVLQEGESLTDFFLRQRKGPVQYLLTYSVFNVVGDYRNELAYRIPFTVISIINVYLFFLLVTKLTKSFEKSFEISIISAFIFSFNGFIFGFSRIAQYQNLNMFFSFLSVLVFLKIFETKKNWQKIVLSFSSTLLFILSFLSHWDAIFYLPLIISIIIYKSFLEKSWKDFFIVASTFLISSGIILGSFLYFYLGSLSSNQTNQEYLERRVEIFSSSIYTYYDFIVLYNPFLFLIILIPSLIFSFRNFKKYLHINLWFLIVFILFFVFFKKPGTHIYNFLIPCFIMIGIFLTEVTKYIPVLIPRHLFNILIISFLTYQTYVLFVDNKYEYPFEKDRVLFFETTEYKYSAENKLPLFGFPHQRNWNQINELLLNENVKRGKSIKYLSNEDDGISKYYLDLSYGEGDLFYYIGIKNPQNFIKDNRPRQYKIVETILDEGSPKVKIWLVEKKKK